MALALKQKSRIGELETPLGKDELVLTRFDATEGLSKLFSYNIEALSDTEDVNFDAALGEKCTVSIKSHDQTRYFNGYLVEADWVGVRESRYCYRLVLRPWLWLLSRETDCRIFANLTVPDIISKVFGEHGFAKFVQRLADYPVLEHVVQYRESDLNFVSRLMEGSGIYYFFEHEADKHTLVLADSKSSHRPLPGGGSIPYRPLVGKDQHKDQHLNHWVPGRRFNSGKVVLKDYDYLKPSASMKGESEASGGYPNDKLEIYDYPGGYFEKANGDKSRVSLEKYARVRVEAEQASDRRCQAAGNAVSLFPGAQVKLTDHPTGSQNCEYLVVQAMHSFSAEQFRSGTAVDADEVYNGRYELLPSDTPYRCPMLTSKPVVHGPQTAVVVGDGEIDVDEHGCILLKFHWDRKHKKSDALRVRVGQVWSGKQWGGIFIPRVGMEVIVEFLEGDPDRPLVVGTVYNDEYMPPYDQKSKEKNIAGWKSRSTQGGGEEDYNEIIFDDTAGCELIRTHAQKDQQETVENDRTIKVGNNHNEKVDKVMTVEAGVEMKLIVGRSSITMTKSSIDICSPVITIKAEMKLDAKSPMTTVKGDTVLTLKGGVVLIN